MSTGIYDIYGPSDWLSNCCSAVGFLDICVEPGGKLAVGICSKCKDHASFTKEGNEGEREFSPEQLALIEQLKADSAGDEEGPQG